jgi:hypothetical protein
MRIDSYGGIMVGFDGTLLPLPPLSSLSTRLSLASGHPVPTSTMQVHRAKSPQAYLWPLDLPALMLTPQLARFDAHWFAVRCHRVNQRVKHIAFIYRCILHCSVSHCSLGIKD